MKDLLKNKCNVKAVFITSVVNVLVWYGYSLLGIAAPQIGEAFFTAYDLRDSLLKAFLLFAAGYVVRPLGGVFFGIVGDKLGRKVALSGSIILMSSPTFLIGILPGYRSIGYLACILIILIRLLQGLAIGGVLTSALSFSIEHIEIKYRGLAGSLSMAGICIGIFLGSLMNYFVSTSLSPEIFAAWGWRIPFICAGFMIPIAFYIIKYLEETPEFHFNQTNQLIQEHPLSYVLTNYKMHIIISIFLNAAGSILFYFQGIYLANYLRLQRHFDPNMIAHLINSTYLIMAIFALIAGYISDIWDKTKLFTLILICLCILIYPMMQYFISGNFNNVIVAHLVLSILSACYISAEQAVQCTIYPSHIRNTGLSISYNIATTIFGGTTPYIMEKANTLKVGAGYIMLAVILSFIALFFFNKLIDRK